MLLVFKVFLWSVCVTNSIGINLSKKKFIIYFSIKMYFFILYTYFLKHLTSDYLFYTTFY